MALRTNDEAGVFGVGGDVEVSPQGRILSEEIFEMGSVGVPDGDGV